MPRILFLTTSHRFEDDRIFHHQAKELTKQGYDLKISSLSTDFEGERDGISVKSKNILSATVNVKKAFFQDVINDFEPHCIIASEPLAVIAAKHYKSSGKSKILYDITEWYPSDRMLAVYSVFLRPLHYVKFSLIQLYAGFLSNGFIFGERSKRQPLALVFPFKPQILLPYFPDESLIFESVKELNPKEITLCYTGQFSEEKGIGNFFEAIDYLRKKKPELEIKILLVGGARKKKDEHYFQKLLSKYQFQNITISKPTSFESFTSSYADADICFDLRSLNFENHHCLPIKIFYYAASGKPVIYTDLKATRIHMDVSKFGYLVDPKDADTISDHILNYIKNPAIYSAHAQQARAEYEKSYNWNAIKDAFVDFIKKAIK